MIEGLNTADQRLVLRYGFGNRIGRDIQMLSEQPISPAGDPEAMRIIKRFDRQIAFSIEADRPVTEIRRTDSHQLIIHDQNFRMDQYFARSVSSFHDGIVDPESVVPVGASNMADEAISIGSHHKSFEQPRGSPSYDRDDFGPMLGRKALRQKPTDIAGGEILRFYVNRAFG